MPPKSAKPGQEGGKKPRKRSPTAGRRAKPWRTRARLDLLPLEPQIAKMVIQRTPPDMIAAWVRAQGTFAVEVPGEDEDGPSGVEVSRGRYADVTDEQVQGMIDAILARWVAVRDDPATVVTERALHGVMLDAAIHDAWNRPVIVHDKDNGPTPLRNGDGTAVVQADHKAIAAYMRERREFYGFGAPTKHVHAHAHIHGQAPPVASLSPADRETAIQELLARRAAALAAAKAGQVPPPARMGPVIDVQAATPAPASKALPPGKKKRQADR